MKYVISLRIFGEKLNPEEVTRDLKINPNIHHKKGDSSTIHSKGGKEIGVVNHRQGMWSKNYEFDETNFEKSLNKIYDSIKKYKEIFKNYKKKEYKLDLFCGIWYEVGEDKVIIDEYITNLFAEINVSIELDEYWI